MHYLRMKQIKNNIKVPAIFENNFKYIPLIAGSLRSSPIEIHRESNLKQQHSFNSFLPLEKQKPTEEQERMRTPNVVVAPVNEPSMIISPMHSSTPEPVVVVKSHPTTVTSHPSFDFAIIPIECKYYFKQMRKKCTFETIKQQQEYLENKYKTLEDERERQLYALFSGQERKQIIEFITSITEKAIESKKNGDRKRLENLLLDQMRKKATLTIERIATEADQQQVQTIHEKLMRTLDLKLQLNKLEKRFGENMPPPSLNVFDKLELHAKELRSDNVHLSTLREQWKNVLRKAKLDLTMLMRQAKVAEIAEATKEYEQLLAKLPHQLHESYDILCHVSKARHEQFAKKKLNFLGKRACAMNVN